MSTASCPHGDESLIVADYLAGRLSTTQAAAFEEHTFGCDRCFEELQQTAELRTADTGERSTAKVRPLRASSWPWPPFGLAAAVLLAVGLWFAQPLIDTPERATDPVYRDAGDDTGRGTLVVSITRDADKLALSWPSVDGADLYEVRVFSATGDPVFEQQSKTTSIELPVANWQETARSGQLYVQVIALDELRQTIVQSALKPL